MERPILFSGEMVRAILAGRKTQTRRVVRGQVGALDRGQPTIVGGPACPYGVPGDRLWVRETFAPRYFDDGRPGYRADWNGHARDLCDEPRWKPSIFMRRGDSRITLEVTAVRVERLQDITEEDARAEGVEPTVMVAAGVPEREVLVPAVGVYRNLWDRINGKRHPWASNPWVWVVSFRKAVA